MLVRFLGVSPKGKLCFWDERKTPLAIEKEKLGIIEDCNLVKGNVYDLLSFDGEPMIMAADGSSFDEEDHFDPDSYYAGQCHP
jgi:hypothetical protein